MQSPTIMMERQQAVTKLEQYEEALRKNPRASTETDRRIAEGYKVLAKGGRLIDVNDALKAGGLNLAGIPKLAIARANQEACEWHPSGGTDCRYLWHPRVRWDSRYRGDRYCWPVPEKTFERDKIQNRDFRALTPHVPLPVRPRHDLSNYFMLWEANWHLAPPRDPYLLRPITGALMEIVAEWDLTDLEIAAVKAATTNRR